MNLKPNPNIIEVPGDTVEVVEVRTGINAAFVQNCEAVTALPPFDAIKNLLSDKPLRKPNRARILGD